MNSTRDLLRSTHEHPVYTFGLTGYPLGHSRSSKIHQAALDALDLQGTYRLYPVEPGSLGQVRLRQFLVKVRDGEIHGLNITIPHKQTVMPLVDDLTPTAAAIGAVNTVYLENGKLIGDNTDGPGFWTDLSLRLGFDREKDATALILGAGGSARAVVYALLKGGFDIAIAARRVEQAKLILSQFPASLGRISIIDQNSLADFPSETDLIVNTTPVGMHPNVQASPWPGEVPFPEKAALYDLVYNPIETMLVRAAKAKGRNAVGGLGMLVEQAALSFERWTGLSAPRDVMMEAANG